MTASYYQIDQRRRSRSRERERWKPPDGETGSTLWSSDQCYPTTVTTYEDSPVLKNDDTKSNHLQYQPVVRVTPCKSPSARQQGRPAIIVPPVPTFERHTPKAFARNTPSASVAGTPSPPRPYIANPASSWSVRPPSSYGASPPPSYTASQPSSPVRPPSSYGASPPLSYAAKLPSSWAASPPSPYSTRSRPSYAASSYSPNPSSSYAATTQLLQPVAYAPLAAYGRISQARLGQPQVGSVVQLRPVSASEIRWLTQPSLAYATSSSADRHPPALTEMCRIHRKRRTMQNLKMNEKSEWVCSPGSQCKIIREGALFDTADTVKHTCSIHGKIRTAIHLLEHAPGIYVCQKGRECKTASNNDYTRLYQQQIRYHQPNLAY